MARPTIYIASHHALLQECAEELDFSILDKNHPQPGTVHVHWKQERLSQSTAASAAAKKHYKTNLVLPIPPSRRRLPLPLPPLPPPQPTAPTPATPTTHTRTSVIPGLGHAVTKDALNSSLEAFRLLMGKTTTKRIAPKTYSLPTQLHVLEEQLEHSASHHEYIYKPSCGSQGKGIHIFKGWKGWKELQQKITVTSVPESGRHDCVEKHLPRSVVQRYIHKPYLKLNGLKFDFRLYVLIESLDPLSIWLCDEGLVRFCTVPYKTKPSSSSTKKSNLLQHLTNYSINKSSNEYVHSSILDPDPTARSDGTKRTLTSVLKEMQELGEDVDAMMRKIQALIVQTSAALQSEIILRSKSSGGMGGVGRDKRL